MILLNFVLYLLSFTGFWDLFAAIWARSELSFMLKLILSEVKVARLHQGGYLPC